MKKPTLKLADFGLAWYLKPGEMLEGAAGTWRYQAPEVHLRLPYNAKSDVYSAGCVAFYMLTGKHPFEGLSKAELVERFSSGVSVDMSAAYARDAGLASLIESMLRFDHEQLLAAQAEQIRRLQERELQWQRYAQANPAGYLAWSQACWYQQQFYLTAQQQYHTSPFVNHSPQQPKGTPQSPDYTSIPVVHRNSDMNLNMTPPVPGSPNIVEMLLSARHIAETNLPIAERPYWSELR
ncbi:hypothetical protein QFC20_002582 [Naganishia adeliensis]|uniref:Uncharacterized protein n=1 Tax=Naganishia adeliensis TaxID=92952 RepID=A0ACC2WIN4_9TREE|nr:hypothetical protein QFC20_002582 [Naganishia adeliensis]